MPNCMAILDGLNAAEIEIPFPQRDLHMRSVDQEANGQVPAKLGSKEKDRKKPESPDQDET